MTDTTRWGAGPAERAQHAGGDGPAPSRRRCMSAKRKQSAVLRLLRGEDLELVSRELAVPAAEGAPGATPNISTFLSQGKIPTHLAPIVLPPLEGGRSLSHRRKWALRPFYT
jgi:hypothetical protein